MARKKRASDEVYNARRRAKRLIARLEREQARDGIGVQSKARASYINSLKSQVAKSYATSRSKSALKASREAADTLNRMTRIPRADRTARERAEAIFKQQLAQARRGGESSITPAQVSVFYAATRRIWQGYDVRDRNERIKRALGVESLSEAFERVISENDEAIARYDDFSDTETPDGERIGSPVWDAYINFPRLA